MIITIDGPVATGKSTIAKLIAEKLHFIYFDTGAMYRCFTWYLLHHGIDYKTPENLKKALESFNFQIKQTDGVKRYFVDDKDITSDIRSQAITDSVSEVSAFLEVREKLVHWQRTFAEGEDVVFEGRDLGSVVFPKADLKIYLVGNDEIRAKRRFDEIQAKFPDFAHDLTVEKVLTDLRRRDLLDSTRKNSPLVVPENAKVIDTSDLSIDGVVEVILKSVPT